jgi:hypothetical protein
MVLFGYGTSYQICQRGNVGMARTVVTKESESMVIKIPQMNKQKTSMTIIGTTPLLVHAFTEKSKREILGKQVGKTKVKEWRSPARDFVESLYWYNAKPEFDFTKYAHLEFEQRENAIHDEFQKYIDLGATFGFPSTGLKKAMASGGYRAKVTKDKVSIFGAFFIEGEFLEIKSNPPEMREDTVRLSSGVSDLRYRPFFREWSAEVNIEFNADVITPTQLANLLNIAGFAVGLGENRPEKGGQFGMFKVG